LAGPSTPKASSELSRAAIAGVLAATGGNVARAARRLGIPRTTLSYRIRVLGLDDHVPRD
jgi:transcriptional regulator with GAF, ATPase, and Fis domain